MIRITMGFCFLFLFFFTFVLWTYHVGVFHKPIGSQLRLASIDQSIWIPRQEAGIHQLIVFGSPFEIGYRAGQHTSELLRMEESELVKRLHQIVPEEVFLRGLILFAMQWFDGVEKFFEPWMIEEMYGISLSSPKDFDNLVDSFTRQVAYHGIHEIGQMMVDQSGDDMGCTVVALPFRNSWVLGRNFDFEGGRIFDKEKILKWVFPESKNAYVSVIWAGMVGAVTGVNEKGIYISLNAAGSRDFRRFGTPSTLVLAKALREANTASDALKIIESAQIFITDIFVLSDSKSGELYRIEKSPQHTEIIQLKEKSIVTNHLISDYWKNDPINIYRRLELTSGFREQRGMQLLGRLHLSSDQKGRDLEISALAILRDKSSIDDKILDLGNRRSIDALIAAHTVVYNASEARFYVGKGPAVAGALIGYDLNASFKNKMPIRIDDLPEDPFVTPEVFSGVRTSAQMSSEAEFLVKHHRCVEARKKLETISKPNDEHSHYYSALGDLLICENKSEEAKLAYAHALALNPAYPHTVLELQRKIH